MSVVDNQLHIMKTIFIVKKIICDIFDKTFDRVVQIQTEKELPTFVLGNFQRSLMQLNRLELEKVSSSFNNNMQQIEDQNNLKIDNFSPNKCKKINIVNLPNNISKQNSRHIRSTSIKSHNLNSFRDLTSSRQKTAKRQVKRNLKETDSFIKICFEDSNEIQQFKQLQDLRLQLVSKREEQQTLKKKNSQNRRIKDQQWKKISNKVNEMKNFSFNYDGSIIRSKPNMGEEQMKGPKQGAFQNLNKVSNLKSNISKMVTFGKVKKSLIRTSAPQILHNSFEPTAQKIPKHKSYRKQIVFNQDQSKSIIQMVISQNTIQKGIIVKQNIDGKLEHLMRDSLRSTSLFDLKKCQFDKSLQRKKFVHRYLRSQTSNSEKALNSAVK